jgi:cytosine deaminase
MDPWYGFGSADLLEVAHMAVHIGQMTSQRGITDAFAAVTEVPARILGLENYGIAVGNPADLLVLQAPDVAAAVRLKPARLLVMRGGKILARQAPRISELALPGRPGQLRVERLNSDTNKR